MSSVPKSQYDDLQKRHENMRRAREREQRRASKLETEVERLKAALNEARRHCANSEWNPAVGAAIATIDEGLK